MKTTDAIKKQIQKESMVSKYASTAEIKAANKTLVLLRAVLTYLESNPREEFIHKQINRLETRLEIVRLTSRTLYGKEKIAFEKKA